MPELKAGAKWKSQVCDTQVMIVKAIPGNHDLSCGGTTMTQGADEPTGQIDPTKAGGTSVGKRYVNADESFELLCVKAGQGTLYLDGVELGPKQAKALPSSD